MKTKNLFTTATLVLLCGCTSTALRHSTLNQSKTVGDFIADQVLYNLVLSQRHYSDESANGIPSFIKLQTGQATVQQTINGQLGLKFPLSGGDELDPQVTAGHQSTGQWGFAPVVDPTEITRLYYLYKSLFVKLSPADLKFVFPNGTEPLGPDGRPALHYEPKLKKDSREVEMQNNQPVYTASFPQPHAPQVSDIPGALGNTCDQWFTFKRPCCKAMHANYLGTDVWVVDKEKFFKFAVCTLAAC